MGAGVRWEKSQVTLGGYLDYPALLFCQSLELFDVFRDTKLCHEGDTFSGVLNQLRLKPCNAFGEYRYCVPLLGIASGLSCSSQLPPETRPKYQTLFD